MCIANNPEMVNRIPCIFVFKAIIFHKSFINNLCSSFLLDEYGKSPAKCTHRVSQTKQ